MVIVNIFPHEVGFLSISSTETSRPSPQEFKRRREETLWKWRRIKTSLVIVIFELRVMTYVVSFINCFELNWFVRFVSHEVWSDKRFVM